MERKREMRRKLLNRLLHRSLSAERNQKLQRRIMRLPVADSVLALKAIQHLVVDLALGNQKTTVLLLHLLLPHSQ